MNMSMQQTECCSESRMRSRTSRGVSEWSGCKESYIGSAVLAIGKVSGSPGIVPGPPEVSRGPPGGATHPGGPHGLKWGGEPAHSGLVRPLGPPPAPRVETLVCGGAQLALGGTPHPWPPPPLGDFISQGRRPLGGLYKGGQGGGQPH